MEENLRPYEIYCSWCRTDVLMCKYSFDNEINGSSQNMCNICLKEVNTLASAMTLNFGPEKIKKLREQIIPHEPCNFCKKNSVKRDLVNGICCNCIEKMNCLSCDLCKKIGRKIKYEVFEDEYTVCDECSPKTIIYVHNIKLKGKDSVQCYFCHELQPYSEYEYEIKKKYLHTIKDIASSFTQKTGNCNLCRTCINTHYISTLTDELNAQKFLEKSTEIREQIKNNPHLMHI